MYAEGFIATAKIPHIIDGIEEFTYEDYFIYDGYIAALLASSKESGLDKKLLKLMVDFAKVKYWYTETIATFTVGDPDNLKQLVRLHQGYLEAIQLFIKKSGGKRGKNLIKKKDEKNKSVSLYFFLFFLLFFSLLNWLVVFPITETDRFDESDGFADYEGVYDSQAIQLEEIKGHFYFDNIPINSTNEFVNQFYSNKLPDLYGLLQSLPDVIEDSFIDSLT